MAHLRKDTPGTAAGRIGGATDWTFTWEKPGQVLEVPDEVALDLVRIPDGGYHLAEPDAEPETVEEPAPEAEISEAPAPRKRAAAKKTAASAPDSVEE